MYKFKCENCGVESSYKGKLVAVIDRKVIIENKKRKERNKAAKELFDEAVEDYEEGVTKCESECEKINNRGWWRKMFDEGVRPSPPTFPFDLAIEPEALVAERHIECPICKFKKRFS